MCRPTGSSRNESLGLWKYTIKIIFYKNIRNLTCSLYTKKIFLVQMLTLTQSRNKNANHFLNLFFPFYLFSLFASLQRDQSGSDKIWLSHKKELSREMNGSGNTPKYWTRHTGCARTFNTINISGVH